MHSLLMVVLSMVLVPAWAGWEKKFDYGRFGVVYRLPGPGLPGAGGADVSEAHGRGRCDRRGRISLRLWPF
jgi:hypothetical protein